MHRTSQYLEHRIPRVGAYMGEISTLIPLAHGPPILCRPNSLDGKLAARQTYTGAN